VIRDVGAMNGMGLDGEGSRSGVEVKNMGDRRGVVFEELRGNRDKFGGVKKKFLNVVGVIDKEAVCGDRVHFAECLVFGVGTLDYVCALFSLWERQDEGVAAINVDRAGASGDSGDEGPRFRRGAAEEEDSSFLFGAK
jgi:hypothetical protein